MKNRLLILTVALFLTSCFGLNNSGSGTQNEDESKFSFDKYMKEFFATHKNYNNNDQTRDKVTKVLIDSIMQLKGDTLYGVLLKFNDLGPTVENLRSIGFKYYYSISNHTRLIGRFSSELDVSKLDTLVEGNEYYVNCIFDGFVIDTQGNLRMTPEVRYDGDIDLGVLNIDIITMNEKRAAH